MTFLLDNYWSIFIFLEVSSLIFLLLFIFIRYYFMNIRLSFSFLLLFFVAIILEAILAFIVYKQTGEFTTFQIVIIIFIIYAATFGISDFKRLDRYVKQKVSKWRGIDLLTDKEKERIAYLKDPKVIARHARYWFYAHTVVFVISIIVLWVYDGNKDYSLFYFLKHLEWFNAPLASPQPFHNEMIRNVIQLWVIIYVVDSIINWSYTLFPSDQKE